MCGRGMNDAYIVSVEGTELRVCLSCSKGKKVLYREVEARKGAGAKGAAIARPKPKGESELVEGYGRRIHEARDSMRIPLKVLAEMISEKEAYISRVEEEKTKPTIELTKKLEKALNIRITQQSEEEPGKAHGKTHGGGATLGDFIGP